MSDPIPVADTEKLTEEFEHAVWEMGLVFIINGLLTVTVALPFLSPAIEIQPLVKVLTVYVVVTVGLTDTAIVGTVPLKAVPSDKVPEIVPAPVTVSIKTALVPLQMVVVPDKTAVGLGFTTWENICEVAVL